MSETIHDQAFAKITNYDLYTDALDRTDKELKTTQGKKATAQEVTSLVDYALSGESFPEDVISGREEKDREARNNRQRVSLLKSATKELVGMRTKAVQDHADDALGYLHDELQKLVGEVQKSEKALSGVLDAKELIRSADQDRMEVWRGVDALTQRYEDVRATQLEIVKEALPTEELRKVYEVGFLRNSLDCSTFWLDKRQHSFSSAAARDRDESVRNYTEWLASETSPTYPYAARSIWPVGDDNKASLVHICKMELWVPTIDKLLTAHKAATTATQPVDRTRVKGSEEARDRFYEVTGTTPVRSYTRSDGAGFDTTRRGQRQRTVVEVLYGKPRQY